MTERIRSVAEKFGYQIEEFDSVYGFSDVTVAAGFYGLLFIFFGGES